MTIKLRYCVLLAFLFHLLLLLSFTLSFSFWLKPIDPPEADEVKGTYIPAYVSEQPQKPSVSAEKPLSSPSPLKAQAEKPVSQNGIKQSPPKPKTPLAKSVPQQESEEATSTSERAVSTLNLISDKKMDKPFLKLLSKATSEKLTYPKTASDFGLHGKVTIRFLIFPSGTVSDVTLVESSGSGVLDQAALDTINAISPVNHVDQYLKQPEHVVVGIIYS